MKLVGLFVLALGMGNAWASGGTYEITKHYVLSETHLCVDVFTGYDTDKRCSATGYPEEVNALVDLLRRGHNISSGPVPENFVIAHLIASLKVGSCDLNGKGLTKVEELELQIARLQEQVRKDKRNPEYRNCF